MYLAGTPEADQLLEHEPFALVIGMVLDQQVPLERAFSAPSLLRERIGDLRPARIAAMDPDELGAAFSTKPALHRFPLAMAERVQRAAQAVVDRYDGDVTALWRTAPDAKALLAAVRRLPGFGEQKAKIFVALLGKQLDVRPEGWREAARPFGDPDTYFSVADIDSPESLERVREHKRSLKAAAKSLATLKGDGANRRSAQR